MKTFCISLDNHASSLALNPDFNQVVIAGSHIFKIYSIEEAEFIEKANLHTAKNLNFCDVVWNPIEENKLATAATNGAVVTWNLSKPSRSKLECIFKDHERTVYKVNFHPFEARLLLSGSLDGMMKLYDLRVKEAVSTFTSNDEGIRDIQFSPHKHNQFAAGTGSGILQLWDIRKPDRVDRHFQGHGDSIFTLDWHPEDKNWLATGCRDNIIKVWDLKDPSDAYRTFRTVASVAKVKWRPTKRFHIASIASTIGNISIFDIRRPYIPFAVFNERSNITSSIAWQRSPDNFLSVGKDSTLYSHSFDDAMHPIEKANPVALDISPQGLLTSALPKDESAINVNACKPKNYMKSIIGSDSFGPVSSNLNVHDLNSNEEFDSFYIVESALNYRLTGRSLSEVCEHNANVAKKLNRPLIAHTWQMVVIIYGDARETDFLPPLQQEDVKSEASQENQRSARHMLGEQGGEASIGRSGGASTEEAGDTETEDNENENFSTTNVNQDYFFGDGDQPQIPFDYDNLNNLRPSQDWSPPNEAFQPRCDAIYKSTTPPDDFRSSITTSTNKDASSSQPPDEGSRGGSSSDYVVSSSLDLQVVELPTIPQMNFDPIIKDTLCYYGSMGDVQMAVSLIIVLGDKIKNLVEESLMEHWFISYIEILHRLKLFNTATLIIQNAVGLPMVQQMNQHSTTLRPHCGSCDATLSGSKSICKKCDSAAAVCAICRRSVHGVFIWCQGCSHGGHLDHILDWFSDIPFCPTGCGHLCEFT